MSERTNRPPVDPQQPRTLRHVFFSLWTLSSLEEGRQATVKAALDSAIARCMEEDQFELAAAFRDLRAALVDEVHL